MARGARIAWAATGVLALAAIGLLLALRVPDRTVAELAPRWAPPPSQFVDAGGLAVHLRDEGPRDDAVPVVLLHGTGASLHTWDGWVQELNDQRRTIRFDLPGFGLTGPSPTGEYTIEAYVAFVAATLDELGVERFILVGNSLGGYVAWATALAHPERVERLVLVAAAGYAYASTSVPIAFRLARTPVIGRVTSGLLPRSVVERSVRDVYGDPARVTPGLVDRYYDLTTRAGNRDALVARFEQMRPGALVHRLPELDVPTLILWGRDDRLIPLEYGRQFATAIRGSRLVVFDGLGHVPHEEDPAATVQVVRRFLDEA